MTNTEDKIDTFVRKVNKKTISRGEFTAGVVRAAIGITATAIGGTTIAVVGSKIVSESQKPPEEENISDLEKAYNELEAYEGTDMHTARVLLADMVDKIPNEVLPPGVVNVAVQLNNVKSLGETFEYVYHHNADNRQNLDRLTQNQSTRSLSVGVDLPIDKTELIRRLAVDQDNSTMIAVIELSPTIYDDENGEKKEIVLLKSVSLSGNEKRVSTMYESGTRTIALKSVTTRNGQVDTDYGNEEEFERLEKIYSESKSFTTPSVGA